MAGDIPESGGVEADPMHQFIISPLFGDEGMGLFTITNSTLWMAIGVLFAVLLLVMPTRNGELVPTRMQSVAELIYGFVRDMTMSVLGEEGKRFFPWIFTIFMFVLIANLSGLIPTSFAVTSHIAVTGFMALAIFLTVTLLGFARHGLGFLGLFWVSSAPTLALRLALFVIELISYFVRPLSHSVRLAGNMMAGHAVLEVFASFVPALGLAGVLPLALMVAVYGLELLVAVVQAYIFAILTCIYLNDALHPKH